MIGIILTLFGGHYWKRDFAVVLAIIILAALFLGYVVSLI